MRLIIVIIGDGRENITEDGAEKKLKKILEKLRKVLQE